MFDLPRTVNPQFVESLTEETVVRRSEVSQRDSGNITTGFHPGSVPLWGRSVRNVKIKVSSINVHSVLLKCAFFQYLLPLDPSPREPASSSNPSCRNDL